MHTCFDIPYGRKIWRELNLADWLQKAVICIWRIKIWWIWKFAEREWCHTNRTAAWPRCRALGGLCAKLVSVGCDGVRVCGGELCSRYHVYKNLWDVSVGEELPCECSGNEKDPYVVAVMRIAKAKEAMYPGRYQLADQLLARYRQIRDRGTIVFWVRERECKLECRYETPPTDVMTKYWWNLIWWNLICVHNPPNRQIFRPYGI